MKILRNYRTHEDRLKEWKEHPFLNKFVKFNELTENDWLNMEIERLLRISNSQFRELVHRREMLDKKDEEIGRLNEQISAMEFLLRLK